MTFPANEIKSDIKVISTSTIHNRISSINIKLNGISYYVLLLQKKLSQKADDPSYN